jgi:hypothetical protein
MSHWVSSIDKVKTQTMNFSENQCNTNTLATFSNREIRHRVKIGPTGQKKSYLIMTFLTVFTGATQIF